MKLDALDPKFLVAQTHDNSVVGLGGYFQLAGQALALNDQRVITRGRKTLGELAENRLAIVADFACLAMKEFWCPDDAPAKRRANSLMAKAHTEDGNFPRQTLD